jgi:hypothetical protein
MFTFRRATHIASLIGTIATIYVYFHTNVEAEITFIFLLVFLLSMLNTSYIESRK